MIYLPFGQQKKGMSALPCSPLRVVRTRPDAVLPQRAHATDIGMDLVAVAEHKRLPNGTILYDTGLQLDPPPGFYVEILPRSSIAGTGWMLANSVGIIDPSYRGNLLIALSPMRPETPALELPFCKCQLVLRRAEYGEIEEVATLDNTVRGTGGFGSSG